MRPPQVVINMKTTITTHGSHGGFVVHSGIQSAGSSQQGLNQSESQWSLVPPSRMPLVETPGGTRIRDNSPLGIQMKPSTSHDNINQSWSNLPAPSPVPPARPPSYDTVPQLARPSTPPSPIYDFSGRDSPPDEFIQPSRITLNVFNPGVRSPVPYEVGLRRAENGHADALINDSVTTTTTVEVFRTPIDPNNPDRFVGLPPPPAPGIDDRPQMMRLNGAPYERWSSSRTETLINDRPLQSISSNKGVQWKENLVDGSERRSFDPYSGARSPFENASVDPRPPSASYQYHVPMVHSVDPRLYSPQQPMVHRSTSPYMIQSPSEYSQTSHPFISNSQEDLRRYPSSQRIDSAMSYNTAPRRSYSPSSHAELRLQTRQKDTPILSTLSPRYVVPDRRPEVRSDNRYENIDYERERHQSGQHRRQPEDSQNRHNRRQETDERRHHDRPDSQNRRRADDHERHRENRDRDRHSDSRGSRHDDQRDREREGSGRRPREDSYSTIDRRRSQSSRRSRRREKDGRDDHQRVRSASPREADRVRDSSADPNLLPGEKGPSRASSRDIFTLYQTRDAMDNVVAQL